MLTRKPFLIESKNSSTRKHTLYKKWLILKLRIRCLIKVLFNIEMRSTSGTGNAVPLKGTWNIKSVTFKSTRKITLNFWMRMNTLKWRSRIPREKSSCSESKLMVYRKTMNVSIECIRLLKRKLLMVVLLSNLSNQSVIYQKDKTDLLLPSIIKKIRLLWE